MCFSWAFFFGLQMFLAGFHAFEGEPELMSVVLALLISALCMGAIIPLDALADADWTDEHMDMAIRSIMSAMGLLIGFGWEQCFDASVDALARKSDAVSDIAIVNTHTVKLALTIFCAGLLVPAWKWYMLPFIVAKGWTADYPLKVAQATVEKMVEEGGGKKKKKEESEAVRAKKMVQIEALADHLKALPGVTAKSGAGGESTTPYRALAGDESAESLKKQIAALTEELAKVKKASLQEQKMLDSTMESMLMSMKQMNETVGRIEASS
jgi:hypothetical protein